MDMTLRSMQNAVVGEQFQGRHRRKGTRHVPPGARGEKNDLTIRPDHGPGLKVITN